jgi:hypothetical protein
MCRRSLKRGRTGRPDQDGPTDKSRHGYGKTAERRMRGTGFDQIQFYLLEMTFRNLSVSIKTEVPDGRRALRSRRSAQQVVLEKAGRCRDGSSRVRLVARCPVLRKAVVAVDGASLRRLEGDFTLIPAVRAGHLGHLSRAAATIVPGTATRRSAISSVIHLRYSHRSLCRVSSVTPT